MQLQDDELDNGNDGGGIVIEDESPRFRLPRRLKKAIDSRRQPLHTLLSNLPPELGPEKETNKGFDYRTFGGNYPPKIRRSHSLEHLFV